jgi:uncharacterized membrane protein
MHSDKKIRTGGWFAFIISMLLTADLAIILDIPYIRQIIGFLFLTLLSGLLILQILKLNKLGLTEKFVLSVGLSISFLMFFGLVINNSSLSLGYETPLVTSLLLISFNIAFVVLAIVGYKVNKEPIFSLPDLNLNTSEKAFLIVPILFPALCIFGMHVMNTTDNNIILMLMLFLIPIYVAFVCFFNQKFSKRLYPVVIFLIGISLVLMFAMRSNHIIGVDRHVAYYYFQTTLNNLHWSVFGHSTLDACLAISLLPAIYQSILNTNQEYLFKILIPLIFSIVPLIIYILSKKYIGETYAFLASFFFMSQHSFVSNSGGRTNIAVFFFGLAMMTLFSDKIDPVKKRILFIVFMASCMVSHYSTTYIFFFVMVGTFIGMEMLSKKYAIKKIISLTIVILFFASIFFWYSQVTEAAFNAGVGFIENTFTNLNKFFVEEMRCSSTQSVLGVGIMQKGIPHKIEFVLTWLTLAFIGIGITTLIRRYKEMSFTELNFKKLDFLREKFEVTYPIIALACVGLLVAVIALPFVSVGYGMDRAHLLGNVILSIFFVIGGIIVAKYLDKLLYKKKIVKNKREVQVYVIILLVLVPYFLSVTGVTYQMFGVPRAITLNSEGKQYDMYYVHDQESYSAMWLKVHSEGKMRVYTDFWGSFRLISQASFSPKLIDRNSLLERKKIKGYIYLRYYNVVNGKLTGRSSGTFYNYNLTEYDDIFIGRNKIYNNGGSELYR